MFVIAVILVLCFFTYIFKNYWLLMMKADWYGTETEACVSRIEEDVMTDNSGMEYTRRFVYVIFANQDGLENEARLANARRALQVGARIRVRYLPGKADRAFQVRRSLS